MTSTFADLGLRPELLSALEAKGITVPTPIQAEAIPVLHGGRDVLGQAATGTGKTAAFGLPMLERLAGGEKAKTPRGLVIVPTRELAIQVAAAIEEMGAKLGARVLAIYGGQPIFKQLAPLRSGVDIVVTTPGRAVDHLKRGSLDLTAIEMVVLDEADEMLDMGFAEELDSILSNVTKERQTALFSATMPSRLRSIADRHLNSPEHIIVKATQRPEGEAPRVRQVAYTVQRRDKAAALARVLDLEAPEAAIVFCKSRDQVDELTDVMNGRGYRAEALHGGFGQEQRDRVMGRLRSQTANLLLATDVAARGLDIDHLTHVINYDVPAQVESYVHRIGRVGRAGREGVAITIAEPRDKRQLQQIERVTKTTIEQGKVPTTVDLRNARMGRTEQRLREAVLAGDFDQYGDMVERLANEFDIHKVALAVARLVHEQSAGNDEHLDIKDASSYETREPRGRDSFDSRGPKPRREFGAKRDFGGSREGGRSDGNYAKIFIGAGHQDRIKPGDLVGAIAGETGLSGKQIGSIDIAPRFAIVEVPADAANDVIAKLRTSSIKGKKVTVRRDRGRAERS